MSLLTTKLNIPPARPQMVPRPGLLERLKEGLSYSLILVSAPAGFGKTTLLSEWTRISQPKVCTAWLSLDEGDNDPIRFWDYFIAALQTVQPGYGEKILPWLHSSQPPPTESMLNALINDLSVIKGDSVIVLDDYHIIASQQIHEGITYLLEHLSAQGHLVIATRTDPPLPLAHYRGKGMMLEIRTDDLRFTQDDAASLLKELKIPGLSVKGIIALNERTEGWVVGLKMAALSMKGQKDVPAFIAAFTGSQRYIMDYLMEEVLKKQPPEWRDFMMKTSVLERLSGFLCDFVTGRKDSREMLLNLERGHLFIVPLDESRQWYRYEHLFADLLRHQCETVYGKEQVAALHRQASQWYEDNNLPDDAIHEALVAKDWERAMRLIYARCEELRKRGEWNTLLVWLKIIPDEVLRTHLRLYSHYAAFLAATGQLDAAEVVLRYLEGAARDDSVLGEVAFTRAIVCRHRGDHKRCIELFEKSFALAPPDDIVMRSRAASNLAHARQRYGPLEEAGKWATQAYELGQQAGETLAVYIALGQLSIIAAYQGKLRQAMETCKKSLEFAGQAGLPAGDRSDLAYWQYLLNDLETSAENTKFTLESGEQLFGGPGGPLWALSTQAWICLARGDEAGADAAMEKMDRACRHPSIDSIWHAHHIARRVMYAIRQEKLEEAARWGQQLPDITGIFLMERYVPARLLLAQGKKEAAARLLQEACEKSIQFGRPAIACWLRVYQALAADSEAAALEFLAEALTALASEGVIRTFVDEGKLLKPLLEKALSRGITPEFIRKLLDIIEEEERLWQTKKRAAAPPPPPGLLSEREFEVLRLLADDIPNQRIAIKLSVSLGTVKTHVHHIIDKLEVRDRRQAVQRARELKLI